MSDGYMKALVVVGQEFSGADNADDASPLTYTETNERQLPDLTETLRRILSDIRD